MSKWISLSPKKTHKRPRSTWKDSRQKSLQKCKPKSQRDVISPHVYQHGYNENHTNGEDVENVLPVGMRSGVTPVGNTSPLCHKVKPTMTIGHSSFTHRYVSKRTESRDTNSYPYTHVDSSTIHHSQGGSSSSSHQQMDR